MPARSVCLVTLSLSEAGPGRFGRQVSVTDIYYSNTIPCHLPAISSCCSLPAVQFSPKLSSSTFPGASTHFGSTFLSWLRIMLVGIWLGLHWVLFSFFDRYTQSSVPSDGKASTHVHFVQV